MWVWRVIGSSGEQHQYGPPAPQLVQEEYDEEEDDTFEEIGSGICVGSLGNLHMVKSMGEYRLR